MAIKNVNSYTGQCCLAPGNGEEGQDEGNKKRKWGRQAKKKSEFGKG